MTFSSQVIPKELLKFRLNKQLARLRQIFANFPCSESEFIDSYSSGEEDRDREREKEDKFQLYQRVLSWFIMGRLAKSEYDAILENLLVTNELIEIHNRVIELLRAIYCDSGRLSSSTNLLSSAEITGNNLNVFNSFSFEFSLLPAEEADLKGAGAIESDETVGLLAESGSDSDVAALPLPASTPFLANPKIKEFQTSIEDLNLTAAEEALLAEALRNPIHELATSNDNDSLSLSLNNSRKSFDIFTGSHRLCTEISSLPDQHLMKQRFQKIAASNFTDPATGTAPTIPDSIAVLACKALEDHMKNILENLVTLKCGRQTLLRPPISYIFPSEKRPDSEEKSRPDRNPDDDSEIIETTEALISVNDLNLLFRMKPWLLADMEALIEESFE